MNALVISSLDGPAHAGQRQLFELYAKGPSSYSQTTGDVIDAGPTVYLSAVPTFSSSSGNYMVRVAPSVTNNLRPKQTARWYYTAGGGTQGVNSVVIATAGTGQTPGVYTVNASAGSAVLQYTIGAGGTLTGVKILNPGSAYTAVPTFTLAANGGTPGTVTATIGSIVGIEVATSVDLSGETVQFFAIGGEF